jgi:hypothetical protein
MHGIPAAPEGHGMLVHRLAAGTHQQAAQVVTGCMCWGFADAGLHLAIIVAHICAAGNGVPATDQDCGERLGWRTGEQRSKCKMSPCCSHQQILVWIHGKRDSKQQRPAAQGRKHSCLRTTRGCPSPCARSSPAAAGSGCPAECTKCWNSVMGLASHHTARACTSCCNHQLFAGTSP